MLQYEGTIMQLEDEYHCLIKDKTNGFNLSLQNALSCCAPKFYNTFTIKT